MSKLKLPMKKRVIDAIHLHSTKGAINLTEEQVKEAVEIVENEVFLEIISNHMCTKCSSKLLKYY